MFFKDTVFEIEVNEKGCCNDESDKSSDLRTLEIQCIGSVISAEKFKKESQEGIKHNIKAERRAFGVLEAGVPDQKAENDQVSLTFPYFSRPKGLRAIRLVRQSGRRVQDSVSKPRGMAECVPVHKIGDPANRLAKDDGRRNYICKWKDRYIFLL